MLGEHLAQEMTMILFAIFGAAMGGAVLGVVAVVLCVQAKREDAR